MKEGVWRGPQTEFADVIQDTMDLVAKHTGRSYKLFEYYGAPDATDVVIVMGSGVSSSCFCPCWIAPESFLGKD